MKTEKYVQHIGRIKRKPPDNVKSYTLVEYWGRVLYSENKNPGTGCYALGCLDSLEKHSPKDGEWQNDPDYMAGYNRYKGDK